MANSNSSLAQRKSLLQTKDESMSHCPKLSALLLGLVTLCLNSSIALGDEYTGTGNWNSDSQWGGSQPTLTDIARLSNNNHVTVTDPGELAIGLIISQGDTTSNNSLTILSGSLSLATTDEDGGLIAMGTSGGSATLNIMGGVLNAIDLESHAEAVNFNAYNFSGGTFNLSGDADFVADGDVRLTLTGSSSDINVGGTTTFGDTTRLTYEFGASGVSSWNSTGDWLVSSLSSLVIDGSGYTGPAQTVTLANFSSIDQTFAEANLVISGFNNFNTKLIYTGTSMNLAITGVPEPSALGILGCAIAGLAFRRRRSD